MELTKSLLLSPLPLLLSVAFTSSIVIALISATALGIFGRIDDDDPPRYKPLELVVPPAEPTTEPTEPTTEPVDGGRMDWPIVIEARGMLVLEVAVVASVEEEELEEAEESDDLAMGVVFPSFALRCCSRARAIRSVTLGGEPLDRETLDDNDDVDVADKADDDCIDPSDP